MKKIIVIMLFCIHSFQSSFSQLPEFVVPQYNFGGNGYVSSMAGFSTTSVFSFNNYSFDVTNNSEFKHTAQNAWYENGKLVFYVISGIEYSGGSLLHETIIYNSKGNVVDIIYKSAMNEIGIVKVGCTSYHLLIGVTLYYLTLEPCLSKSNFGGAYEIFDLESAGIPLTCQNIHPGTATLSSFTSFAISKPDMTTNSYTIYYFGIKDNSLSKVFLRKQVIYFHAASHSYLTDTDPTQTVELFQVNNPFIYSSMGEMELSADQTKLAYIDENTVNVYDLVSNVTYTYDVAKNYPNLGTSFDCATYFPLQPCGLEFNEPGDELAISFHDIRGNNYWPSGKNALMIWSSFVITPAVTNIVAGTSDYANSFIETGNDKNWYMLGPTSAGASGAWGTYFVFDPSGNNPPTTGQFPSSSELNLAKYDCPIKSCQPGGAFMATNNHFRTLPSQIDGLDISVFESFDCCTQYDFDFANAISHQMEAFLSPYYVNSNTTFDENKIMYRDIIVRKGHTLTIKNCVIRFRQNAKILVEAGAQLIIDNATLTDACNKLWPGITLMGDNALAHSTTSQGFVHLLNNAIIEHAVLAILVKPKAVLFGVGGSKILDCLNGVTFEACPMVADNISFFQDMTFECTGLIPTKTTGTITFLEITGINLIGVYGCTFKNTASRAILNPLQRGTGVVILNSSVGFHKTHCLIDANNCVDQNGNATIFDELTTGIFARNSEHVMIDYSNFTNCQNSITFMGVSESFILRCQFELSSNAGNNYYQLEVSPLVTCISDFNTTGLHVLQNEFYWDNQNQLTYAGILLSNMGLNSFPNEIRNNKFIQTNRVANTNVRGIYQDAKYDNLKVEWNSFDKLTYGWYLEAGASVNNQTHCIAGSECPDPMNKWVDAGWSVFRICNNSNSFLYSTDKSKNLTEFDPNFGVLSLHASKVKGVGFVNQDEIGKCNLPIFDPIFGVNKSINIDDDTYNKNKIEILLSPNPIQKGLLNYALTNLESINEIIICNWEGVKVYDALTNKPNGEINLDTLNLNEGLYTIRFLANNEVYYAKFIKQ